MHLLCETSARSDWAKKTPTSYPASHIIPTVHTSTVITWIREREMSREKFKHFALYGVVW
jgi:hypothetical protein